MRTVARSLGVDRATCAAYGAAHGLTKQMRFKELLQVVLVVLAQRSHVVPFELPVNVLRLADADVQLVQSLLEKTHSTRVLKAPPTLPEVLAIAVQYVAVALK